MQKYEYKVKASVCLLVMILLMMAVLMFVINLPQAQEPPHKYEFTTQDNEQLIGTSCHLYNGHAKCVGEDGTIHIDVKKYRRIDK